jgi:hypothetical protein
MCSSKEAMEAAEKPILQNFGLTDYTRIQKVFTGVVQHLIRYSKEI